MILSLLIFAAAKNGSPVILGWVLAEPGDLVGGLALFVLGLRGVLWPERILKKLRAAYPSSDARLESAFSFVLTRILHALAMAAGLLLLSYIKRGC